jgi:geranylgeranyl reductase family protein
MQYDVIVVGAGPGGSTTARECAGRGLSVVLLDRAEFPRDKPCGGGVSLRAARLLPFDLMPVVERTAFGMRLSIQRSQSFVQRSHEPITYLTQRSRLDTFLVEKAVRAGVILHERASLRELECEANRVTVRTTDGVFQGRTLVAADGANGVTARCSGLQNDYWLAVALEGNVSPAAGFPSQWDQLLGMDAGDVPGGYGWIFPKGDHLNLGVAGWKPLASTLRARLAELAGSYGFDPATLWNVRGHHLPLVRTGCRLARQNVLLVGDAAGLIDPLTLEGIHGAIWSGQTAARHLCAHLAGEVPDLLPYQHELEATLLADLRVGRQIYDLSYLLGVSRCMKVCRRLPVMLDLLWACVRGELTYTGFKQWLGPMGAVLDLASDSLRANPRLRRDAYMLLPPSPGRFWRRTSPQ